MILESQISYILPAHNEYALYLTDEGILVREISYWAKRNGQKEGLYLEEGQPPKYCQDDMSFLKYCSRLEIEEVLRH